ncbi:MAG: 16S rRNA (guanine(527)-N(7))-methyltransferase RsmG [Moraxellaceae bacterium]|nr:16S rRNA (guanine(527)-N(7))-methyltransferase RsmG [Moraxellaceae bacterium]MDP1776437.1 16S rRNA (guanine(527)-N(7))-methyltransferase RsmG [Moraxellaceae bacterium]
MALSESISQRLTQGAHAMDMALTEQELQRLLTYLAALIKWNKAYNLTAIRDPLEMVDKHLLDSLSILPHIDESPLIDIGTGAGLPGMIIALMRPTLAVTLLDSNGKKTRFLKQLAAEMALSQVTVVNDRCEQHSGEYGQITSRAFASLADMVTGTEHMLSSGGRWLAMKGHVPEDEISALASTIRLETTPALRVPFRADARHLIILRRN